MTLANAFWILMFLWLLFGAWDWRSGWAYPYGHGLFLFLLFFILGWKSFGQPIHG